MIKSFWILLHVIPLFIHAYPDDENNYETYIVLKDPLPPDSKDFPFDRKKSLEDDDIIKKHSCPAETDEDVTNIEHASKNAYKLKYCLFEKNFQYDDDKVCKKEVKPVLIGIQDEITGNDLECGSMNEYELHAFSYFECGSIDILTKFREKSIRKNPSSIEFPQRDAYYYEICYDTKQKRVMWTKHEIQTPELLENAHLKSQQLSSNELSEISTNSYFMDDDLFLVLKKKYDSEKNKDASVSGNFIMLPRPLVPLEHLAFMLWKKTANHYMNMAPLWETLVPLMTAIDERVQKIQQELASRNPNSYSKLQIYTRVVLSSKVDKNKESPMWSNLKLFEGNIWYKFIYHEDAKSGALVIVHNTPGNPPSEGCLKGAKELCKFEKWSDDESINQRITEDVKKYAYCCRVWRHDIMDIFAYDPEKLENNFLNIDCIENLFPVSSKPLSPKSPEKEGRLKKRVKKEEPS